MAGATEMGMAKAYDRFIIVLVARAVFVYIWIVFAVQLVARRICFWTQLHHPEGDRCSRVNVTHPLRADDRAYILYQVFRWVGLRLRIKRWT